jgi:transcriptional regulator NrdR family protein
MFKLINKDGVREEFEDDKLYNSVYYAARECDISEEDASGLADKVLWEMKAGMTDHETNVFSTREIRTHVNHILEAENEDVAVHYMTHQDIN